MTITESLTHEELEEVRNNPNFCCINCWEKKFRKNGLKSQRKKDIRFSLWWWTAGSSFAIKGYDVTIMDFLNHNYKEIRWLLKEKA